MKQRFKAHKLLRNNLTEQSFIDRLTITKDEEMEVLGYRREVRSCLRNGFQELRKKQVNSRGNPDPIAMLTPKFWTQGSFSYGTLNEPAHLPPQQIDLDDGVYFPMALVNGKPVAAKNALLNVVWRLLEGLADRKGWGIKKKPTCARLLINDRVHIDVPVYAIPEARYQVMNEAFRKSLILNESLDHAEIWLDPNEVYLAKWDDDEPWIISDPQELERWFKRKCSLHGQTLRRVCRYLKAWRDYTWRKGGPSSIALMAAVVQVYDCYLQEHGESPTRDCQGLLAVAKKLPTIFRAGILNPIAPESALYPNGHSPEDMDDIQLSVERFAVDVDAALCHSHNPDAVVLKLQQILGNRVPSRPDWVEYLSVTEAVRSIPPKPQSKPSPSRSHRSA